ncbi:DNA polymerase-3 subunit delta' [Thiogranum longum]|uniref:DNA polymerase III subunit delta' n=1 Tax=Thiogranum longum TaxID=1537524 RepID=A0A4R1H8Y8_9GAMM|nr:DNA polymerase III subunit delta' [Thiogranum longum]TCK18314.1 DNA polymerase-3 subunit delta' [Thiogranum longum]
MTPAMPWLAPVWQQINRARQQSRLPHALLLSGSEGVGKKHLAERIAHALLCESPNEQGEPCGQCAACGWLAAGTHPDLLLLEPEEAGKAIKVDQVRALSAGLGITSHGGRYKVAIVRPAEAMNMNAANSLLKTLEEPTANTLLILGTAAPGRLIPTVRSRCQKIQVPLPSQQQALGWLAAHNLEGEAAVDSLLLAGGGPLYALVLHQEGAEALLNDSLQQLQAVGEGRLDPLTVASEWQGDELALRLAGWRQWLQWLIRAQFVPADNGAVNMAQKLHTITESVDCQNLYAFMDRIDSARNALGSGLNRQLMLEDLLIRWAAMPTGRQNNVMQGSR